MHTIGQGPHLASTHVLLSIFAIVEILESWIASDIMCTADACLDSAVNCGKGNLGQKKKVNTTLYIMIKVLDTVEN